MAFIMKFVVFMKNQDNKDFEKHMENNPQVHPDFLEYLKKHNFDIKGPGLNKFILLTFFNLNKFINRQQKGGGSNATTEDTGDSNATTETEKRSSEKRSSQATTEEENQDDRMVPFEAVDQQIKGNEVGLPMADDIEMK